MRLTKVDSDRFCLAVRGSARLCRCGESPGVLSGRCHADSNPGQHPLLAKKLKSEIKINLLGRRRKKTGNPQHLAIEK